MWNQGQLASLVRSKKALLKKNKEGEIVARNEHGSHKQVVVATEAAFKNGSKIFMIKILI